MSEVIARKSVIVEYQGDTKALEEGSEKARRATLSMREIATKTGEAITKGYEDAGKSANALATQIDRVTKSLASQRAEQKRLQDEINEQNKITAEFKAELVEVERQMQNVKRFSQDYAVLTSRQKNLTAAIKDQAVAIQGLKAEKTIIDSNVRALQDEEKALRASAKATGEATTIKERFNKLLEAAGVNISGATSRASALIGMLRGLRIALISTGIGAIVVALGLLVAAFLKTQRGADTVTKALTPVRVAFQTLFGTVQDLSHLLADLFTDPGNTMANFGSRLREIGKSAGEAFRDGVTRGREIADLSIQLENLEKDRELRVARINRQITEQMLIVRNTARSDRERKAAINEVLRLTQQEADIDLEINRVKQRRLELEQQSNDAGRAGQKELNDLKAEEIKLEDSVIEKKRELAETIGAIEKRAQAEALTGLAKYRRELEKAVKTLEMMEPGTSEFQKQAQVVRELAIEVKRLEQAFEQALALPEKSDFDQISAGVVRTLERRLDELNRAVRSAALEGNLAAIADFDRVIQQIEAEITAFKARNGDATAIDQIVGTSRQALKDRKAGLDEAVNNLKNFAAKAQLPETIAEKEQRLNDQRIQNLNDLKDAAQDTFASLSEINASQIDDINNLVDLQTQRVERYEKLAETGSARQLEIEEERLSKLQAIQLQAQQRQRQLAQAQIATSQAVTAAEAVQAIVSAFKSGGPLGIITGIATSAALALAIASTVRSISGAFSSLPAFKEGTEEVRGRGTTSSDSILARVSRGERITDATTNRKIRTAASGLFPNKLLPHAVEAYMGMPAISEGIAQLAYVSDRGFARLTEEVAALRLEQRKTRIAFTMHKGEFAAMVTQYNREQNRLRK